MVYLLNAWLYSLVRELSILISLMLFLLFLLKLVLGRMSVVTGSIKPSLLFSTFVVLYFFPDLKIIILQLLCTFLS